ncbi:MAG: relaxase/mobilization nuclease domain-containing protein [Rhizobiales bacterium]|nr:relaxase/mobilization nuclease domain-containing protein [Hyphomicrobiales bacterium]
MNDRDNDHITVFELRGFLADDLHGALAETHAISKGTKCTQFMFSLSLNPPKNIVASEQDFLDAANKAEERLRLEGQPRAIIFHEKEGRRHAHVVWSRIDHKTMTAINLPHFKRKLNDLARDLYLDHGWELPNGLRRDGGKSPLNFTLAQWQQAKRIKLDPREIKQSFAEAWQHSDSVKGFKAALEEKGYFLAKGDRRGHVAMDINGEVFSVPKWLGIKTKEVKEKLGDSSHLPSVEQTRDDIKDKITDKFRGYMDDVDQRHVDELKPLNARRAGMVALHRIERAKTLKGQAHRLQEERKTRSSKLNTGLRGLWEKLSGAAGKIKKTHELEAWQASKRDQQQRDDLVKVQMKDRTSLQRKVEKLRRKHTQNRRILARDVSQAVRMKDQVERMQSQQRQRDHDRYRGPSL